MHKKFSIVLLICMLCLAGCGSKANNNGNNGNNASGTGTTNNEDTTGDMANENATNNNGIANGNTTSNGQTTLDQTEDIGASADENTAGNTANNTNNTNNIGNNTGNYHTDNVAITDADTALKRLIEGNRRFVNDESVMTNVTSDRRAQLQAGQQPYACVVACSDSRVTPNIIFNTGLGEIFEIRIAGNIVDANALGSIEYAVEHLGTPLIVVMGHEACGAVTAAYDNVKNGTKAEGNINSLVEGIAPAINDSDSLNEAIEDNIDSVADQIRKDEIVNHLVHAGKVRIVEAYYSLNGEVIFEND